MELESRPHGRPLRSQAKKGSIERALGVDSERMTEVRSVGATVRLDAAATDSEFLGVLVRLYADLENGERVETHGPGDAISGPRTGLGAVWVRYDGDGSDLPTLDRDLYARDASEAVAQALARSYRLRLKDIEDSIRLELFEGGFPAAPPEGGGELDPEQHRLENQGEADAHWTGLICALSQAGVPATPDALRRLPFVVEFNAELRAEVES